MPLNNGWHERQAEMLASVFFLCFFALSKAIRALKLLYISPKTHLCFLLACAGGIFYIFPSHPIPIL